jgi:hypothetical protein
MLGDKPRGESAPEENSLDSLEGIPSTEQQGEFDYKAEKSKILARYRDRMTEFKKARDEIFKNSREFNKALSDDNSEGGATKESSDRHLSALHLDAIREEIEQDKFDAMSDLNTKRIAKI